MYIVYNVYRNMHLAFVSICHCWIFSSNFKQKKLLFHF